MTSDYLFFAAINVLAAWSAYIILSTGSLSLANGAFMAMGAYLSSIMTLKWGIPLVPATLLAGAATAVIGLVLAFPALRVRGVYFILLTVGITFIVQTVIQNTDYFGGVRGISGMSGAELWHVLALVVVTGLALVWLSQSHLQRMLDATREDDQVAQALGINTVYLKVITFVTGALLASFAGTLYAHYVIFINPENFGINLSLFISLYVVLGGVNNLWGPLLGAVLISLLPEMIRGLAEWRSLVFGGAIVMLLLVRSDGLLAFRTLTIRAKKQKASHSPSEAAR
jgi:branched-chain amino acid transport system permease protein